MRALPEHSILGDAAPVIMISLLAVNLNKSSEINGQWLHFSLCVRACFCVRLCLYLFVCSQKTSTHPLLTYVSAPPPCSLLSVGLIYCTRTHLCLNYWTGIIKVRLHRCWPLRKHMDVFHPPKGAIKSVSQGVTQLSGRLYMAKIAHTNPPAIQSQF